MKRLFHLVWIIGFLLGLIVGVTFFMVVPSFFDRKKPAELQPLSNLRLVRTFPSTNPFTLGRTNYVLGVTSTNGVVTEMFFNLR